MSESNENVQRTITDAEVQEKLANVKAILARQGIIPQTEETVAQEPEVEEVVAEQEAQGAAQATKIDWSQFDLDPTLAFLYPHAEMVPTKDGPKLVAMLDQFEFITNAWSKLGAEVSDAVNGPDRWNIATVLGNGAGMGVVMLRRQRPFVLPNPRLLQSQATMPAVPQEAELQTVEDTAIDWIKAEGVTMADLAADEAAAALDGPDFGIIEQAMRGDSEIEGA